MASDMALIPLRDVRQEISRRGGSTVARCYQCATCTSVCMLATPENLFPRRQMLWSQWGLGDRLASDPSIWLCHQCNDCSERCPRDARPGDVMQVARSLAVMELAFPRFVGALVGRAAATWALLLAAPLAFWVVVLYLYNGLTPPSGVNWAYGEVVPHWLIYAVFFPVAIGAVGIPTMVGAARAWKLWGRGVERGGSFVSSLVATVADILTHKRFSKCGTAAGRKWGHFFLFWGFVVAATTSGFIVIWMYGPYLGLPLEITFPVPQTHWMKIMGNLGAVALVIGGLWLLLHRLKPGNPAGASHAFDNLFLAVVLLLIATGVLAELGRLFLSPSVAMWTYILHLSSVLCLFLSIPYSKFAHILYRTLAMVHEHMAKPANR